MSWLLFAAMSAIMLPEPRATRGPEMWKRSDASGRTVNDARRQRRRPEPEASVGCHQTATFPLSDPGKLRRGSDAQERQPMFIVASRVRFPRIFWRPTDPCRSKWGEIRHTVAKWRQVAGSRAECFASIAAPVNKTDAAPRAEWPCITRAIRHVRRDAYSSGSISRHSSGGASCWIQ